MSVPVWICSGHGTGWLRSCPQNEQLRCVRLPVARVIRVLTARVDHLARRGVVPDQVPAVDRLRAPPALRMPPPCREHPAASARTASHDSPPIAA